MPLKVLVIDPNAAASSLVHNTLAREGYEVATVASLDEGLTVMEGATVDLVLISSEAGPEALEGWWHRAEDALAHVPLLLIGGGAEGVVPSAGTVGTPIDADDLLDKVRGQLGAPDPAGNLAWLPDALKEASTEIAEMERLLGWSTPAEPEATAEADPVSLGIFTEEEMQPPAGAEGSADMDPGIDAEAVAEGMDRIREPESPPPAEAETVAATPSTEAAPKAAPKSAPSPANGADGPIAGLPPERVQQIVAELAREAVERVVWETVPNMVARFISESRAEQDKLFTRIVERVVWETVPEIAEAQVKAEIQRISEGDE